MKIWREYEGNPDRLLAEARRAYLEFIPGDMAKETMKNLEDFSDELVQEMAQGNSSEQRFKVVEASNRASLEIQLNEEPGWDLHSFSVAPYPAQPGTTSQKVVIIAVLVRQKTTAGISSGD